MRALVLSGGGSRGQYHVGAIKCLLGELGTQYDILCGVSVGALVAAFLAQYKHGDEGRAAAELAQLFSSIEDDDIWKRWFPFGKLHGLWRQSFLNSLPLQKLVRGRLSHDAIRHSGKKLRVGAVSLSSGQYMIFDETHVPLADAVLASSSFPAMLAPLRIRGEWWTDGGVRCVTPIQAAIEAGADEIDIVMTTPPNSTPEFDPDPSAVDIAFRSIDVMSDEIVAKDLKVATLYNVLVSAGLAPGKRRVVFRVVRPGGILNADPLKFDPKEAAELQLIGYEDALKEMG